MVLESVAAVAAGAVVAAWCTSAAHAGVVTFTWNPAAIPGVVSAPGTIVADAVTASNYNRTTNFNDLTQLRQFVVGDQYQPITGFTLGGVPVVVPGFNSSYGLYFHVTTAFSFPINPAGVTVGPPTFTQVNLSFMADVGHDDGTLSTNAASIGFSNAAGTSNDVVLATGSLLSSTLFTTPDGKRGGITVTTFSPTALAPGFFVAPNTPLLADQVGLTLLTAFSTVPVDATHFITLVDGTQSGGTTQFVPEPASITVLLVSLLGVLGLTWRRSLSA